MSFKKKIKRFFIIITSILLLLILSIAITYLLRNQIITSIIEKTGSTINGAKVDITELENPFLSLTIKWKNMEVADKNNTMKNIFETGPCEFSLQFKPLFAGKFIIETIELSDVKTGTQRKIDGKLPPKHKKVKQNNEDSFVTKLIKQKLENEKNNIPIFNPNQLKTDINVNELLAKLHFQTPQKADSLKILINEKSKFWENKISNNQYEQKINTIKKESKKINLNKIKSKKDDYIALTQEVDTQLKTLKKIKKTSNNLINDIKKDKQDFENDAKILKSLYKDVPNWIQNDYKSALNLAQLPDIEVENIAVMLFGEKVSTGLMFVLDKIRTAREMAKIEIPDEKNKTLKEEKMPELPKFWIKNINWKGIAGDGMKLSGKITDISENQDKTKRPIQIKMNGFLPNKTKVHVTSVMDFRGGKDVTKIKIDVKNMPINNFKLSNFSLLPKKLKSGFGNITLNVYLNNDTFTSDLFFIADKIQFDMNSIPKNMNKRLVQVSHEIANSIKSFNVKATISYDKKYSFKLNSNLDKLVATKLKSIVDKEIGKAKQEIKIRVEKELKKYENEVRELALSQEKKLRKELEKILKKANFDASLIDKNEQEIKKYFDNEKKKYENKAKNELEDKLKDGLDDVKKLFP